jgi:hypothetical protein
MFLKRYGVVLWILDILISALLPLAVVFHRLSVDNPELWRRIWTQG